MLSESAQLHLKYKQSLYHLAKEGLGYRDVNLETHGRLIKILESNSTRKLILLPRGTLKSSLACVALPIWILINNPNERILIDSELYTNSSTFLREIKQHLQTPLFTHLFGEFKGSVWNDGEIIIKQRTAILKEASITCSGIGATKIGQHYSWIIMDDMNSPANTANKEQAEKVITHYRMQTSILEPKGSMVVIGTRYSELDLYGTILQTEVLNRGANLDERNKADQLGASGAS